MSKESAPGVSLKLKTLLKSFDVVITTLASSCIQLLFLTVKFDHSFDLLKIIRDLSFGNLHAFITPINPTNVGYVGEKLKTKKKYQASRINPRKPFSDSFNEPQITFTVDDDT